MNAITLSILNLITSQIEDFSLSKIDSAFILNKFTKKIKPKDNETEKNNFIDGDFEDIEDDDDRKI